MPQQYYFNEFNLNGPENELLQGLINGAPYLCSALIGCWSNAPLNVSLRFNRTLATTTHD